MGYAVRMHLPVVQVPDQVRWATLRWLISPWPTNG